MKEEKIEYFRMKDERDIHTKAEMVPGRRVKVVQGYCCAKKKLEKIAILHSGFVKIPSRALNFKPEIKEELLRTLPK